MEIICFPKQKSSCYFLYVCGLSKIPRKMSFVSVIYWSLLCLLVWLSESCFPFWSGYLSGSGGEVCSLAGYQYAFWLHCGHWNQWLWGLLWKRVSSAHEGRSCLSQHVSTASWISTGIPLPAPPPHPPTPFIFSHLGEDMLLLNGLWEEELNSNQLFGKARIEVT